MIILTSNESDIIEHISQMKLMMFSNQELMNIENLLKLEDILNSSELKKMIAENLKDKQWLKDTKILLETANKKKLKNDIIQNHISECVGLLLYKILEKKCKFISFELTIDNNQCIFWELTKEKNKQVWMNAKFFKFFINSNIQNKVFQLIQNNNNLLSLDLEWLYKNKSLFFSENVFKELNYLLERKVK